MSAVIAWTVGSRALPLRLDVIGVFDDDQRVMRCLVTGGGLRGHRGGPGPTSRCGARRRTEVLPRTRVLRGREAHQAETIEHLRRTIAEAKAALAS